MPPDFIRQHLVRDATLLEVSKQGLDNYYKFLVK